jgi:hypothetical protein
MAWCLISQFTNSAGRYIFRTLQWPNQEGSDRVPHKGGTIHGPSQPRLQHVMERNVDKWSIYKETVRDGFKLNWTRLEVSSGWHFRRVRNETLGKMRILVLAFPRLSIRPYVQLEKRWTDFHEIWYLGLCLKFVTRLQFLLNETRITDTSCEDLHAFLRV